jgi:hypothetical protein
VIKTTWKLAPLSGDLLQPKSRIKHSPIMRAATGQAGDGAFDPAHSRKILAAIWATVEITRRPPADRERKIVTTLFIRDAEISAGAAPLPPMRPDFSSPGSKLSEQMRQFVAKRAFEFIGAVIAQARIQRNQGVAKIGAPGAAS